MKMSSRLLCFSLSLIIFSCSERHIRLSADFERGSIGNLPEIKPGFFRGNTKHWIESDNIGNQYYWFYFRADHVKDRALTVELTDLIGVYRGNTHIVHTNYTEPVFSYDQDTWERISEVSYDSAQHSFRFSQAFNKEPVWIAFAHPYTCSRLQGLINSIKNRKDVKVESLSKTEEGRDINLVSITDNTVSNDAKKSILILAAQHSGEDAGAFLAEGLIKFLVSDSPEALLARQKFIFAIVPMMNPDGFYHGITRYNTRMVDLNNIWTDDSRSQPEVTGVKLWIDSMNNTGKKIDLFIDLHNHTQFYTYNVFIFQDNSLDSLAAVMDKYWPIRTWHSGFKGSSCAWMLQKGIPNGTIELSQSRIDSGAYLTIDDYESYGKGTVLGITEYFGRK